MLAAAFAGHRVALVSVAAGAHLVAAGSESAGRADLLAEFAGPGK